MAMLNQGFALTRYSCPAGLCREQERTRGRTSWSALAASFAAGALAVSAVVLLAGGIAAPGGSRASADRAAAAAAPQFAPRELPPEWRWRIEPLKLDGMFRKQR